MVTGTANWLVASPATGRARRLDRADVIDTAVRHVPCGAGGQVGLCDPAGLNTVDGQIRLEQAHQPGIRPGQAARRVDAEQRRAASLGTQRKQDAESGLAVIDAMRTAAHGDRDRGHGKRDR
jgi:hypothetical protein